ncbi:Uncharacterized protein {ECO:0000313/EMBL:CCF11896.1} [Pantoea ananatis]|nr:hypothetical protein PANA5342_pPANA10165 [Pantoea ananatis LMG 5342]CRH40619.1 Uncharacterized protein {ECO:0000313/EMBL:CCF11896.1} [Pantoea ananatis]
MFADGTDVDYSKAKLTAPEEFQIVIALTIFYLLNRKLMVK